MGARSVRCCYRLTAQVRVRAERTSAFHPKERRAACAGFVSSVVELRRRSTVGEVAAEGVSVAFQELVLASFEKDVVGCEINDHTPCVEKDHPGSGDPVRVSEPQLQPQVSPYVMTASG